MKIAKHTFRVILIIIAIIIVAPFTLYIPPIQNWALQFAVEKASEATGMQISAKHISLRFPLTLSIDEAMIKTSPSDTMVYAKRMGVDVAFMPLLKLDIKADGIQLDEGYFHMVTSDSTMMLTAKARIMKVATGNVDLRNNNIDVSTATLNDGYVKLIFDNTKEKSVNDNDTAKSKPWYIAAKNIKLTNVHYYMEMLPIIDMIDAKVATAELQNGIVDMANCRISAESIALDNGDVTYLTPDAITLSSYKEAPDTIADDTPSQAWTITCNKASLSHTHGVYAVRGAVPRPGFDMNYIEVSDAAFVVDSFYNRRMEIRVPIKALTARERSGISVSRMSGEWGMDSTAMYVKGMEVFTDNSHITADGNVAQSFFDNVADAALDMQIDANISPRDIAIMYPEMKPLLEPLPMAQTVNIGANFSGALAEIDVKKGYLSITDYMNIKLSGMVAYITNASRMSISLNYDADMRNISFVKRYMADMEITKNLNVPRFGITGSALYNHDYVSATFDINSTFGSISFDGDYTMSTKQYSLTCDTEHLNIHEILPEFPLSSLTMAVDVSGNGFDVLLPETAITAESNIDEMIYNGVKYDDIQLKASLNDGIYDVALNSNQKYLNLDMLANGYMERGKYSAKVNTDIRDLNLKQLGFTTYECGIAGTMAINGDVNLGKKNYNLQADVSNIALKYDTEDYKIQKMNCILYGDSAQSRINMVEGDFSLNISAPEDMQSLYKKLMNTSKLIDYGITNYKIDADTLQKSMPRFDMLLEVGKRNFLYQYVASSGITFDKIALKAKKDSVFIADSRVLKLQKSDTRLDTVYFNMNGAGGKLLYHMRIGNKNNNHNAFSAFSLNGFLQNDELLVKASQRDKGKTKNLIALDIHANDSIISTKLYPENPIINFRKWTLNGDNYITYAKSGHIDANVKLQQDSSLFMIRTVCDNKLTHERQEPFDISIKGIQIADWLSLSPFAPPIQGVLGANLQVQLDKSQISANGSLGINNFRYNNMSVGNMDMNVKLNADTLNVYSANVSLNIDKKNVLMVDGQYAPEKKNAYDMDVILNKMPLKIANPFLSDDYTQISGYLDGDMDISGNMANPRLDGYLQFESAYVSVPTIGVRYPISSVKVPVDSNMIRFNNFGIRGYNDANLTLNGVVDLKHLDDMRADLKFAANNFQFVNARKKSDADLYGKGFLGLNGTAKGPMSALNVGLTLRILGTSNFTYTLPSFNSTSDIIGQNNSLVKFVEFSDTLATENTEIIDKNIIGMTLNANINIDPTATIGINLTNNGNNGVQVAGGGNLVYTMDMVGNQRFTGRYNIASGYVKYSVPLIPSKNFVFKDGSYLSWNGDIANPTINVTAVDNMKANVSEEGQDSRLVTFDISMIVSNDLNNLNLKFDLSSPNDLAITNELTSMTPEQRSNQAINLMLYNTYTGIGTSGSGSLAGNPLNTFITKEINNWAAQNIKAVDVSFGINSYDKTVDGIVDNRVDYSYKISKSLFDDRFKIVIGGTYNTQSNNTDEITKNLFNDVSIEYMLNKSANMYVKIFQNVGQESILEGNVTRTGVGFVMRRKVSRVSRLFKFRRQRKSTNNETDILKTEQNAVIGNKKEGEK